MNDNVKKIPMLEKFAAQSLVKHEGELIFSKEKFAELIVEECANQLEVYNMMKLEPIFYGNMLRGHFGTKR